MVLKRNDYRLDSSSTATIVWCWLTAEEAEAALGAAAVFAVRQWWLEERQLVVACQLVGENSCGVSFCWLQRSVAEATDEGLKCFIGFNVNISGLEGPACSLSRSSKEVSCPGLKAFESLGWLRCIPLKLVLASVAVKILWHKC